MRAIRLFMAVSATIGTLPTVAMASTVSVDPLRDTAVFRSGAGASDVTSDERSPENGPRPFSPAVPFSDAAQPLSAGPGCLAGLPVWCQASHQDVYFGAGDDRYSGWSFGQITVAAGGGSDDVTANGIRSIVSGGGGFDTIAVGSNGYSFAYGNAGDDHIRSVPGGVETSLSGGNGNDLLFGERPNNNLSGDNGNDDLILLEDSGTLSGAAGADTLMVLDEGRSVGRRTLNGGDGADTIVGGVQGIDAVSGGNGSDTIDVAGDVMGAVVDTVDCGPGDDTVYADAEDLIATNCETRNSGPMPASAAVEQALAQLAEAFGPLVAF